MEPNPKESRAAMRNGRTLFLSSVFPRLGKKKNKERDRNRKREREIYCKWWWAWYTFMRASLCLLFETIYTIDKTWLWSIGSCCLNFSYIFLSWWKQGKVSNVFAWLQVCVIILILFDSFEGTQRMFGRYPMWLEEWWLALAFSSWSQHILILSFDRSTNTILLGSGVKGGPGYQVSFLINDSEQRQQLFRDRSWKTRQDKTKPRRSPYCVFRYYL